MAELGTAYITIMPSTNGMKKAISEALEESAGSKRAKSSGGGFGSKFGSALKTGIGKIAIGSFLGNQLSKGVSAIAGKISSSMGSAISRLDTLNNFPKVMASLGVGTDEATSAITMMSDRLSTLPTRLDDMTASVQGVYAAGRSMGMSLTDATKASLGLNDMLLAGGQGSEVASAAMIQFTQALSKGKPDMQDWKSLVSAAPAQMDQLAKSMLGPKANSMTLYEALKKGKVSMSDLMAEITKLDQQGGDGFQSFAAQAESATGGVQTQLSNLSNAFTKGLANMMQAIGQSNIVGAIKGIKSVVDGAFKGATEFVSGFVKTFDPSALINSLSALGDAFMDGFGPVPDATNSGKDLGKMATSLAKKLKGLSPIFYALGKIVRALADVLTFLADHIKQVVETIIALKVARGVSSIIGQIGAAFGRTGSAANGAGAPVENIAAKLIGLGVAAAGIGAGIWLIANGFATMSTAAIALASAGTPAMVMFGVMAGLVAALVISLMVMAPTLTANVTGFLAFGAALLMAGVAIMLVANGFAIMAQSVIAVSAAGTGASVLFGMLVVAITAVLIVMMALAPTLTLGAVGLIALGIAALGVGVGIALACAGIALLATQLPTIASYGLSAAVGIAAIGASCLILGVGATVGGIGLVVLAAGLAAAALGAALAGVGVMVLATGVLMLGVGCAVAGAAMMLLGTSLMLAGAGALMLVAPMMMLMIAMPLTGGFAAIAAVGIAALGVALGAAAIPAAAFSLAIKSAGSSLKSGGTGAKQMSSAFKSIGSSGAGAAGAIRGVGNAASGASSSMKSMGSSVRSGAAAIVAGGAMAGAASAAMASTVTASFSRAASASNSSANRMKRSMSGAASAAASAASRISSALSRCARTYTAHVNVTVGKLPHFSFSGKFDPQTGSVPKVSVSWYAKGGIFRRAAVFGEAGPEAVTPLNAHGLRPWAEALDAQSGDDTAGAQMVIAWLDRNLGGIISGNTPTMSARALRRIV
ncbi:MAG TPA: hypothetical protein DEV22_01175 [Collinsella sp.]|nr:hypothetical protein [Collinsella sp.]